MKITTFFIDKFTEVSFTTPQGIQEDGGVYGDELGFSTWELNTGENGTSDFIGVNRTNILYGELYKITLDTGDDFNTAFVPRLNDFHNMDLQIYWDKILSGQYKFNNVEYSQYRPQSAGLARRPGGIGGGTPPGGPGGGTTPGGGTGGPTPGISATLVDYAMGVKERIGWIEVNRTRSSIYYEYCFEGKRARSDHFYDSTKFIVTPELFDPLNDTFVAAPNTIRPITTFSYEKINPYSPDERFFTLSTSGISTKRIGLIPIDTWFNWNNNNQGHVKVYKGQTPNEPNAVIAGFTTFAWPMGPMWGQMSVQPNDYLISLTTGNHVVLDADVSGAPFQRKLDVPTGIGNRISNTPLLIAQKESHLNSLMDQRLIRTTEFGTPTSISPEYSMDIWGEKRSPESLATIRIGFYSSANASVFGECQKVNGLNREDANGDVIEDPYGFDLYNLEKQYKSLYDKYKFCPPRKKTNTDLNKKSVPVQRPNQNEIVKVLTNNTEEYTFNDSDDTKFIKVGAFNPDQNLIFQIDESPSFNPTESDLDIKHQKLDISLEYFTENGTLDITPDDDLFNTPAFLVGTPFTSSFIDDVNYSFSKNSLRNDISKYIHNSFEIERGIRRPNDLLVSNPSIPYGTFNINIERSASINQSGELIINKNAFISQNGSDADPQEFKNSVSSIINIAGNGEKNKKKPIGVSSNGFPIYPKNTAEESIRDIVEQLTGVKEIIFRGSEVEYGTVSQPIRSFDPLLQIPSEFREVPKKVEYVNTGITVSGKVDVSATNKSLTNFFSYGHKRFNFMEGSFPQNLNKNSFMEMKESTLGVGEIDFIGTYSEWNTNLIGPSIKDPMSEITHILISAYDVLGKETKNWAPTEENPGITPISSSSAGTLFLKQKGPSITTNTFVFSIVGEPTFINESSWNRLTSNYYFKIPVKFRKQNQSGPPGFSTNPQIRYATIDVSYSKKEWGSIVNPPPPPSSSENDQKIYGGWIFSGLWHRDGGWPLNHKFRSGLLGSISWSPCDGGVNTGAWIKVPSPRIRLEYHDFPVNGKDAVYSYIHSLWLIQKNEIFNNTFPESVTENILLSPFTEDNLQFMRAYEPNLNRESSFEDWEKILDTQRTYMVKQMEEETNRLLILRLRDNNPDPSRGLKEIPNYLIDENINIRPGGDESLRAVMSKKRGHMIETWIIANNVVEDDRIMDMGANYGMRWYPEPTEHTMGMFKKDEWYRAIFTRAVTSPSHPNGQIGGTIPKDRPGQFSCKQLFVQKEKGKYPVTPENKRIFCDTLYITEQIFKMHRSRLIEMKKYVDNKIKFFNEKTTSERAQRSFKRSMEYVKAIRNIARTVVKQ